MASERVITEELDSVPDRRGRKRAARHESLLRLAAAIVAESGVAGLTMSALAEASDYAPASLYTYFKSRSALVAALQQRALLVLAEVAQEATKQWARQLVPLRLDHEADLAELWAFSALFLSAPEHHPQEFALQQELLVSPEVEDVADAASVVPMAMVVLEVPRRLLERARINGVLDEGTPGQSPLDEPLDTDLVRTLSWVTALNGALLTDRLATGLPTTGAGLGAEITRALLIGWGADAGLVDRAREIAHRHLTVRPSANQGNGR